jgi:hypothetical protein
MDIDVGATLALYAGARSSWSSLSSLSSGLAAEHRADPGRALDLAPAGRNPNRRSTPFPPHRWGSSGNGNVAAHGGVRGQHNGAAPPGEDDRPAGPGVGDAGAARWAHRRGNDAAASGRPPTGWSTSWSRGDPARDSADVACTTHSEAPAPVTPGGSGSPMRSPGLRRRPRRQWSADATSAGRIAVL